MAVTYRMTKWVSRRALAIVLLRAFGAPLRADSGANEASKGTAKFSKNHPALSRPIGLQFEGRLKYYATVGYTPSKKKRANHW